jgi:hypothetical protein
VWLFLYNKVEGGRWKKEEGRWKKEDMSTGMVLHKYLRMGIARFEKKYYLCISLKNSINLKQVKKCS